jgi:hypothetical protein
LPDSTSFAPRSVLADRRPGKYQLGRPAMPIGSAHIYVLYSGVLPALSFTILLSLPQSLGFRIEYPKI